MNHQTEISQEERECSDRIWEFGLESRSDFAEHIQSALDKAKKPLQQENTRLKEALDRANKEIQELKQEAHFKSLKCSN